MNVILKIIEPKIQIPEERKKFSNRLLAAMTIPVVVEQFLLLLVGIFDTMMISYAGEEAVSAVSLDNQITTVFVLVFSAVAAGGSVVASQYVGSGDRKNGIMSAGQLVMLSAVVSVGIMTAVLFGGRFLFTHLFGSVDQAVLENGLIYLRISAYSFPFLAIYSSCAGIYRSMGKTKPVMYVSIVMNIINVAGNAIGIFGLHAGVKGVAYPSLIARLFAAAIMFALCLKKNNILFVRFQDIFQWDFKMIGRISGIAIPNGIENGLFQVSKVAMSAIVALYGTSQIAANGVAQSFWSLAALSAIAMGTVFVTIVGQYIGARDADGANYYMHKLLRITIAFGFLWNMAFLVLAPLILKAYQLSPETTRLTYELIIIHNVFDPVLAAFANSTSCGLRAAGDAKFTMYAAIFSTVVCRVILSVIFGLILHGGVIGIAWAMVCDWAIHTALIIWRWKSGKWKACRVI